MPDPPPGERDLRALSERFSEAEARIRALLARAPTLPAGLARSVSQSLKHRPPTNDCADYEERREDDDASPCKHAHRAERVPAARPPLTVLDLHVRLAFVHVLERPSAVGATKWGCGCF